MKKLLQIHTHHHALHLALEKLGTVQDHSLKTASAISFYTPRCCAQRVSVCDWRKGGASISPQSSQLRSSRLRLSRSSSDPKIAEHFNIFIETRLLFD